MNMLNKVSLKYTSFLIAAVIVFIVTVQSEDITFFHASFHTLIISPSDTIIPVKKKNNPVVEKLKYVNDTLLKKIVPANDTIIAGQMDLISAIDVYNSFVRNGIPDSLIKNDTGRIKNMDTLQYISSKNAPDTVIEYTAEDSMVLDVPGKTVTLYGKKATTKYKDNNLTAPVIELDQATGNIIASIKRDSTGKAISLPTYKQGDFLSQSDSIKFNMKSGKGLTKSTYTQQGEMYVYGETIKKIDNNVFYALRGRFTTCNLDTPHFAFVSNKIKFINNKVAITGPVHPEFEGIPIPIYFPFGIYPLSQGRHSGLLQPTFTTNQQRGLGIENLGYYKVVSDYWDVILRGSIYSYGGWSTSINPRYKKNYKYQGSLTFNIQSNKYNFKGDPDYSRTRSYLLTWSHSMDSKARPGVSFSASVNAGSSSYYSSVPDNPYVNFNNQLQSSIAYSKTWKDKPFNLTITANHNQNTNLKIVNVNLPDVGFNVATIYPFRKKDAVGTPKWFENIGIAYNGNAKSLFSFYDTAPHIFKQIADTFQYGAHHSLPISLSLPQMGIFQVAPSVSYDETWYQSKTIYSWDTTKQRLDTAVSKGFYTARQMTFGIGISTRIFGLITAKNKNAKIQAIRHEITPTLGVSYHPYFNQKSFYTYRQDSLGDKSQLTSVYTRNIFSPYSAGRFGGLNFGIDNNISMKVRDKKDTGANALKKISLIDGLSLTGSYNFFADSFQLSTFAISARSNLFNKINITASGQLDPYDVNSRNQRINELVWKHTLLSLGRLVSGSVSVSSSFQSAGKDGSSKAGVKPVQSNIPASYGYTQDQYDTELADIRNNPGQYADFNIPWSLNFSYALTFSRIYILDGPITKTYTQNINFGGTLNLTKKWQLAANGFYNVTEGKLNQLSLSISRDLHCWQMSISVAPVGLYRSFSINIAPKSPLLRDIRVNRTRTFYNSL
jgi:LPS-assembly protein